MICDKMASNFSGHPKDYIHTLVKLEELRLADTNLAMAVNRNKNELLDRIKWIATTKGGKQNKVPATVPLFFAVLLLLLLFSFRTGYHTLGGSKGISRPDFFASVETNLYPDQGAFVLYDVKNGRYYTYNDSLAKVRFNPYSTFKVFSTLVALGSGTARDKNFTIKYDSIKFPSKPWMRDAVPQKFWFQDHNLQSALQYSVNWFYLELHQKIGEPEMDDYIHRCNYGNRDISSGLNNFWLGGSLGISAFEQVEFLNKMYFEKLKGFTTDAQELTKQIMLNESSNQYRLYGKTGTGEVENDKLIGWYIGFLETENNAFIFALNMLVDDYPEISSNKRQSIIKQIFRDLQIIR
jgi:beta-lactamase class D